MLYAFSRQIEGYTSCNRFFVLLHRAKWVVNRKCVTCKPNEWTQTRMDTKYYHVYVKNKNIHTRQIRDNVWNIWMVQKKRLKAIVKKKTDQQIKRIKTEVGKEWFTLAEFLSSVQISSYVSHFVPQKRRAGSQLKLNL